MAETVRKSKLTFLKLVAKLFASVLGLIGVLSGCDTLSADYGVESVGVSVFGHTVSSFDSSYIEGIQVSLSNTDSTVHYDTAVTGEAGSFHVDRGAALGIALQFQRSLVFFDNPRP